MDDYKLNFSLCTYMCTCGYYKFSWDFLKSHVNQAIYNNQSSFSLAFPCKRCGRIIALEFMIKKDKDIDNMYFIESKFLFTEHIKK